MALRPPNTETPHWLVLCEVLISGLDPGTKNPRTLVDPDPTRDDGADVRMFRRLLVQARTSRTD
jgi:hypothetical protein